nr:helix-turn-helix domain-containing protein [Thalassobacillus pellis]
MADKYKKVDYGKLIYLERVKQGLTQEQLSRGVCSITYLSKLENHRISDPNQETVELLLNKLDLTYYEQESIVAECLENMERLYKNITSKNELDMKRYYKRLKALSESFSPDLSIWSDLVSIRYFVYWKNFQSAKRLHAKLHNIQDKLDDYQSFYFHYFSGLVHCLNKKYDQGTTDLHVAEKLAAAHNLVDPELFYHLALTYSHLNNASLAIYYSQTAKSHYDQSMNIYRSLDCQVIVGINYLRIKRYEKAERVFTDILEVAGSIQNSFITGKVCHNLGYLYAEKGETSLALNYFHQSLENKEQGTENYYRTVLQIVETHQKAGEIQAAMDWVEKALLDSRVNDNELNIPFQLKKLELEGDKNAYYTYIKETAIPHFLRVNNRKDVKKYAEKAALYLEENFHYKKANHYYKLILMQGGDSG